MYVGMCLCQSTHFSSYNKFYAGVITNCTSPIIEEGNNERHISNLVAFSLQGWPPTLVDAIEYLELNFQCIKVCYL